jgi:hypothetical protein
VLRERGIEAEEVRVRVGLAVADAHVTLRDEPLEEGLEGAPVDARVDSRAGVRRVEPAALQAVVAGAPGAVLAAVGPLHVLGQVVEAVLEGEDLEPEGLVLGLELAESRVQEDFGDEGEPFDAVHVLLVRVLYKAGLQTKN